MKVQIEEMAKDICHLNVSCDECTMLAKQMGQSKERYCKAMQYAKRAYEKGYRKQSEWISVEDRLPERNGRYITHCKIEGQSLVCVLYYCKVGGFNEGTVTHWMPLPEPPKMKGGE